MSSAYEDLEELKENLERLSSHYNEIIELLRETVHLIDTIEWKLGFTEEEPDGG